MLIDAHGLPLNPKLREQVSKPALGWIVCQMLDGDTYRPVMDGRTNTLGIAPSLQDAVKLATTLAQRELTPRDGALVKPGQESSKFAILRLVGDEIVQVSIDPADKLVGK